MSSRGGPQYIPRPAGARLGSPAPWSGLPSSSLHPTAETLRAAFDGIGPALPSPRAATVPLASAVLVPCYEDDDGDLRVILTRRSSQLRVHKGEISFPGGRRDPGEDLLTTARREACEEVGLDPSTVEVVGELDHLSTVTSRSFIVPYVGMLPGPPSLVPNPSEVDAILHVPMAELLDPTIFREERWPVFGAERSIVFFDLVGDTVWGATAAMLRQLLGFMTGTLGRGDLGHD